MDALNAGCDCEAWPASCYSCFRSLSWALKADRRVGLADKDSEGKSEKIKLYNAV